MAPCRKFTRTRRPSSVHAAICHPSESTAMTAPKQATSRAAISIWETVYAGRPLCISWQSELAPERVVNRDPPRSLAAADMGMESKDPAS
jgi:hypothetical protein